MTDLGYRTINRSAFAHSTAELTKIYLGVCETHNRPVRYEGEPVQGIGGKYEIPCPEGGTLWADRLVGVTTTVACDSSCMGAFGPMCGCGCGGLNHGKHFGTTSTHQETEAAITRWREAQAKTEAKRQARSDARVRRARQTFEDWAAASAGLIIRLAPYAKCGNFLNEPCDHLGECNSFLADLARQVTREHNRKPLSENQISAAVRCFDRMASRALQEAAWQAEAKPVPEGKVTISGEIIKIKAREGYLGAGTVQLNAIVSADGYAVQLTLPRALENWARSERARVVYPDRALPVYGAPDYDEIASRWTKALKGTKITFSATVQRGQRDDSFGFASRPVQVKFTPAEG